MLIHMTSIQMLGWARNGAWTVAVGSRAAAQEDSASNAPDASPTVTDLHGATMEHASSSGHSGAQDARSPVHGPSHGPGWDVGLQAINFALFALLIVFIARGKVRAFFDGRRSSFRDSLQKAAAAKREAEQKKREIQDRIARLESTADSSVEQARAEAELLKARMLAEAEALRKSLREDAERTVSIELERAKAELRAEMIAKAVETAKSTLSEKIAAADQKRLQTEFVEKIQVVRP